MKQYISPAFICIDINTESVMQAASGQADYRVTFDLSETGNIDTPDGFAAPEYRTNLWQD